MKRDYVPISINTDLGNTLNEIHSLVLTPENMKELRDLRENYGISIEPGEEGVCIKYDRNIYRGSRTNPQSIIIQEKNTKDAIIITPSFFSLIVERNSELLSDIQVLYEEDVNSV